MKTHLNNYKLLQIAKMLMTVYPVEISKRLITYHIEEMLKQHNITESKPEQKRIIEKIWHVIKTQKKQNSRQ